MPHPAWPRNLLAFSDVLLDRQRHANVWSLSVASLVFPNQFALSSFPARQLTAASDPTPGARAAVWQIRLPSRAAAGAGSQGHSPPPNIGGVAPP